MNQIELKNPVFVIGSPRSGTSLLRLILTNHSQVLIPPECGFVIWLYEKYKNWKITDNNDTLKVELFINDLLACKKFETWSLNRAIIEKKILNYQPIGYAELCEAIYRSFGVSSGKEFTLWGDKNNFYLNYLDELLSIYKNARFLHIVRDGRDVACSYREVMGTNSSSPYAPKLKTEIDAIASEWSHNVMKINSFMRRAPQKMAMTIRYEDLVSTPHLTVKAICEWLDISFEASMFDFYQNNKSKKLEPDLTMDWKKRTLQPISDATVGQYIELLSDEEQSIFLAKAQSSLQLFSYV